MSEQDLAGIVERASTLDERLGGDFVSAEGEDAALVESRLEEWSWALGKGDWDRFRRRLAWDGLAPETIIVSSSLENLKATRIVIAHRLSTIMNADRIYVLEAGRIVQSGTYTELMEREGPFRDLAARQIA